MNRNKRTRVFVSRILSWGSPSAQFFTGRILGSAVVLSGLLFLLGCNPKQTQAGGGGTKAECGECLDMPTGEVCTVNGTRRNSCMAICENAKILCFEACPCPDEK